MNIYYQEAINNIVFKEKDHHRFLTADDKDIIFNVVTISPKIGKRIPIICNNFEKAKKFVLNNDCDLYEAAYKLVVIEGVYINRPYGTIPEEQYWYAWKDEDSAFKAIETPEIFKNTIGFGIG